MKIFRIKKNEFPLIKICGATITEIQNYFLGEIIDVNSIEEITTDDYYALIYDDTPLISLALLRKAKNLSHNLGAPVKMGNAIVTKKSFLGESITLRSPLARKFNIGSYQSFLSALNKKILYSLSKKGVVIHHYGSTFIDLFAKVEEFAIIYPKVSIYGNSVIKKGAIIGENTVIENSTIGENTIIKGSYILDSKIGANTSVGPYSHVKNNSIIGNNCRIGDYVEIKNSIINDGVKSAHLTYIGDAHVGNGVNVGCGTVFCNYNGKSKHHTTIGNNVFIGANTNLIAPLIIGNDVFIGAGSTVNDDIPDKTFFLTRAPKTERKNER